MANKKVNVEIEDFEDKKAQSGKRYTRFKTSEGWMSAFDKEIIDKLKEAEENGQSVKVEIAEDKEKGFKNIRAVLDDDEETDEEEPKVTTEKIERPKTFQKDTTTMYVSYAKDIFLQMHQQVWDKSTLEERKLLSNETIMAEAIKLVKMARNNFQNDGTANSDKQE